MVATPVFASTVSVTDKITLHEDAPDTGCRERPTSYSRFLDISYLPFWHSLVPQQQSSSTVSAYLQPLHSTCPITLLLSKSTRVPGLNLGVILDLLIALALIISTCPLLPSLTGLPLSASLVSLNTGYSRYHSSHDIHSLLIHVHCRRCTRRRSRSRRCTNTLATTNATRKRRNVRIWHESA